jgi:oxygen-independent coproporphyrinogen-3 oxidase
MVDAICKEIETRKHELATPVSSIYFGGGTPSLLTQAQLEKIFSTLHLHYSVNIDAEITLEINPDDVEKEKISFWMNAGINRASMGIQSFDDTQLKWMNRAHKAMQAKNSVYLLAEMGIENISIDLIYGLPEMTLEQWHSNLKQALALPIQHISSYCLTVEPKTALYYQISKGITYVPDDDLAATHFDLLTELTNQSGFEHYEISNFGMPGYHALHNSSYWQGKSYLGIGPSAHSYNAPNLRKWNIANNTKYIKCILSGQSYQTEEYLSLHDRFNEWLMTGLRTLEGCKKENLDNELRFLLNQISPSLIDLQSKGLIEKSETTIKLSPSIRFLADGIASSLFVLPD